MTLARRMTILMSLMLVGVIASMLWLAHKRVEHAIAGSEMMRLQASANQLATTLYAQSRRLSQDAGRMAAIPEIRRSALAVPGRTTPSLTTLLDAERARSPQIRSIAVWNAAGEVVASSGTRSSSASGAPDRAFLLETASTPSIGPLTSIGDTVTYAVTAPLMNLSGKPVGYVVVTRQLTDGGASAALLSGLVGHDARVLLGNADGDFLSDLTAPIAGADARPPVGTARSYVDSRGVELVGAAAAVPETPWKVIAEAPRKTVLGAAGQFTFDSALFGSAFVLIGAFLSWLLIRRTMRPLGEVTSAARGIAGGDLSRRVAVDGTDEVATLANAFNQMIDRVTWSASDLAARAGQLEEKNKELNESEAKYRSLFEHLPDGIIVHRNQSLLFANPSALRILGVPDADQVANHPVLEFVLPADRERVIAQVDGVVSGQRATPTVEVRIQRADRKIVTVEATSMPLRIEGAPAVQTVLHDVSERRLLEEQFRQSQKMDAVGRLAGGVAHDFNNLLTVIQAHAEFALAPGETEASRREDIEEIRKTAESAARLTRQLLTFSRKQTLNPASIDLNDAISGMLGMIKRLIGDNIEVITIAGEDLCDIWADPGQIQQVLLNLVVNARDAMPEGGVLRLETANITVGEGYRGAAASAIPPGEYVMLAVQDTGVGMTEEIRTRVFEPFFTTKQPGSGTGLGLSTVYGIVKQSAGHIWVYSEPGLGTAFKVFFPPHRTAGDRDIAITGEHEAAGNQQGRLLVVEDDASVRTAVVRALRGAGFAVTEAADAKLALEVIAADPGLDLLITDVVMPGMSGTALLADARALRPRLPAIILSGYSGQGGAESWRVPEQAVFVDKPVSPTEIIRRVRQLLAARV